MSRKLSHRCARSVALPLVLLSSAGILGLVSCRKRIFHTDSKSKSESVGTPKTACVGLQGNGIRFASHVGTYLALLENDILPVVSLGGSSGSIVAASVMSLLENTSYDGVAVSQQEKTLSKTQKAGLILGASSEVLNSFLFLPNIQKIDDFIASLIEFGFSLTYGNALLGNDATRIVSLEATVGQAVLLQ
jgi:hypothetical protein